jgi:hypothetical protein
MSKNAEVVQGTCAPAQTDVATPLVGYSSEVQSVLVQPNANNVGNVKVGYETTTPVMDAPLALEAIAGKVYNLNKVVIQIASAGDGVTFIATR